MAIHIRELRTWLEACEQQVGGNLDDSLIYVDEDGATLGIDECDLHGLGLAVGGEPEYDDDFDN